MKNKWPFFIIRLLNIFLLVSLILTIVSCNGITMGKDKQRKSVVTTDTPWYDGTIITVDLGLDTKRSLLEMSPKLAGADDKLIVIYADGVYQVEDWGKINCNADYCIRNLSIIDRSTKQTVKVLDLYKIIDRHDWLEAASYYAGKIIVRAESWDSTKQISVDREYTIDIETESIININDYDYKDFVKFTGSYSIGEYRIDTMYNYYPSENERTFCPIRVFSPEGSISEIDLKDSKRNYYPIPIVFSLDDKTALVPVPTEREYDFYKIDLEMCKATKVNAKDYQWVDTNRINNSFNGSDGKVYYTTRKGVCVLDMVNKTSELIFDYNSCGVNRKYLSNLEIADCSEDSFLLCGQFASSDMFTPIYVNNFAIIELKKVKKNPHAGKRIIELYAYEGYLNEAIFDAIINYNNSSAKSYIVLSDRYDINSYLNYDGIRSLDDYDSVQLNANAELSNNLAMDIMNGVGPDILMNTSSLGQLNNDNYLVDLSACSQNLDSNKCFTNIIDGSKHDGKLYQFPISFTIEGIQTAPEYAGKNKKGFTTKEYKKFLYETLNGKDVIESGQALYFVKLFNGMSDEFIVNGKVYFDNPKFADIAEFVKESVQSKSISWDSVTNEEVGPMDFTTKGDKTAYYCNCPGISGYLVKRAQVKNGTAILGIPSSDGRGPMCGTDISVAVSKNAADIDACVQFVKMLITDEIQEKLAMSDKLVINREAFRKGCRAAVEYYNTKAGSQNLFDYSEGTYVTSHMKFSAEDIDNLEKIVLSCSKMNSYDATINAILIEEMPAYFKDQKDLSEVVTILQDRVQKVLDERG